MPARTTLNSSREVTRSAAEGGRSPSSNRCAVPSGCTPTRHRPHVVTNSAAIRFPSGEARSLQYTCTMPSSLSRRSGRGCGGHASNPSKAPGVLHADKSAPDDAAISSRTRDGNEWPPGQSRQSASDTESVEPSSLQIGALGCRKRPCRSSTVRRAPLPKRRMRRLDTRSLKSTLPKATSVPSGDQAGGVIHPDTPPSSSRANGALNRIGADPMSFPSAGTIVKRASPTNPSTQETASHTPSEESVALDREPRTCS